MAGPTLTVLGCGNLGTAILRGIFTSKPQVQEENDEGQKQRGLDAPSSFTPPSRFVACVHSAASAKRVKDELLPLKGDRELEVVVGDNSGGVQLADVVILAVEPAAMQEVLDPISKQLSGKLLVSILAGKTVDSIRDVLQNPECTVARVLPNTSAAIGESMTAFASDTGLSAEQKAMVRWVFGCVGQVVEVPTRLMDVSTALSGSGVAFAALLLEAMAQGGVAMGLSPRDAQVMAAQVMKGTAQQVLNGEHAAVLRDKVTTPGGCTIAGLCTLEESGVRGGISKAVREATTVVGLLGRGVPQPNRTRLD